MVCERRRDGMGRGEREVGLFVEGGRRGEERRGKW